MSDKTYVFTPDGGSNNMLGMLAPLLKSNGLDPNLLFAMNNGGGFGGNNGSWFLWIILLFAMWRNGAWGGNGTDGSAFLSSQIANADGRELLMQSINGNRTALSELASTLNCSVGQIQSTLNGISNSVGLSAQQIINSVQAGNANIAAQLAQCCCDIKTTISGVSVGMERGFSNLAFETQKQTCEISKSIESSTSRILEGQRAAELRELQRDITERDRKIAEQAVVINNGQQTAIFGQMISQATTPIAQAVGALQADLNGIKCKLPETTTIPYSPVVGIPTCVAALNGYYGGIPYGAGTGGFFGL